MQLSGAEGKALQRYGQGLASQDYSNFLGRYADYLDKFSGGVLGGYGELSGIGQRTATQTGYLGQRTGTQIGQNYLASGQAQSTAALRKGNALAYGIGGLTNTLMENPSWYKFGGTPQSPDEHNYFV